MGFGILGLSDFQIFCNFGCWIFWIFFIVSDFWMHGFFFFIFNFGCDRYSPIFGLLDFLSLFATTVSYLPRVISPQLRDAVVDTIWFINRNQVWNGLAALLLLSSSRFVWVSFKKKPRRHVILQSFCRTLIIKWNWWKII